MVRLPITFGAHGSVFNGPGFGIEILDHFTWSNTLRIRLKPGRAAPTPLKLTVRKDRLSEEVVETGMTTFEPGVKLCVEGTWMYEKIKREEVATFDATYPLAVSPISVTWHVDGTALSDPSGSLSLPGKTVKTANSMLTEQKNSLWVIVKYEIHTLPNGARLRLFNQPDDQTYDLAIDATLTARVGNGSEEASVKFEGIEYRYPPEFYERWSDCFHNFIDIGRRYVRYKVLLEPDLWKRVPDRYVSRVQDSLILLGQLHEQGKERAFRDVVNDLEALVGVTSLMPLIVDQEERIELPPVVVVQELGSGGEPASGRNRGLGSLFIWLRKLLVGKGKQ
jgi:hypothetical protein